MNDSIKFLIRAGLLASLGIVLSFFKFPLFFMPGFLTIDFSDVPALIGSLLFGWPLGMAVILIKNIIHTTYSTTFGIGEIADFSLATIYMSTVYLLRKQPVIAYPLATLLLAISGVCFNYYLLLPLYNTTFHITTEQLLAMAHAVGNPALTIWDFMFYVIFPFNIVKGLLIAALTIPVYRRIKNYGKII